MNQIRTRSTGKSSDFYGHCEICGKYASDIHTMSVRCSYTRRDGTAGHYMAGTWFGHKDCLDQQARLQNPCNEEAKADAMVDRLDFGDAA